MGEYTPDEPDLGVIKPYFTPNNGRESPRVQALIKAMSLEPHIEGGYFKQTDVSSTQFPSPYPLTPLSQETVTLMGGLRPDFAPLYRQMSTTIFYYITPNRPQGHFHRNRSRIIHSLHRGRGRYVLIHPNGHVETYIVGHRVEEGERLQWVVEGGVWKACFLLEGDEKENEGMLISETVVPGFEYADHEFLSKNRIKELVSPNAAKELEWLVRDHEGLQDRDAGATKTANGEAEYRDDETQTNGSASDEDEAGAPHSHIPRTNGREMNLPANGQTNDRADEEGRVGGASHELQAQDEKA